MLRKAAPLVLGILICYGFFVDAFSQPAPKFFPGVKVQFNSQNLRPQYLGGYNYYSTPCVADWNGDGKKDLLAGYFYQGWIYFFVNSGTDQEPVFSDEDKLKSNGITISVGYG
jgi:hypothetical protein